MKYKASIAVLGTAAVLFGSVLANGDGHSGVKHASFNSDGSVIAPTGYQEWVYVGTPLTPNALNDGAAAFPEFHTVYVEPSAFAYFKKTGKWAEGSQIVKELNSVAVDEGTQEDGSTFAPSGRGYFQGPAQGLELTVKDNARFKDQPGGWAYFSFGHHAPPYSKTAKAFPAESCNSCHEANAADTDFVFTKYYPVLKAIEDKMAK